MNPLDQVLEQCKNRVADQSDYYELFLNTRFFIPVLLGESSAVTEDGSLEEKINPVLLKGDGKSSIMLFDSEERFNSWTNGAVGHVAFLGHAVIALTPPDLHLTVNPGTRFTKEFVPEEIALLKRVVHKCREELSRGTAG